MTFRQSKLRTRVKVRALDATALGLKPHSTRDAARRGGEGLLPEDDPRLVQVRALIADQFGGVIFTGPPGTSKTWYASQIALKLVEGDRTRARFVQFHPSYQYEDFVEGYVPRKEGGFRLQGKHLLEMCKRASADERRTCVLVIDELSRVDPGRVFGECLTYLENTKRKEPFHLASGTELSIPPNLVFLATMNPMDRGVEEVDAALERRFAKIAMDPDPQILDGFLTASGMPSGLKDRVMEFFQWLLSSFEREFHIGQTYFLGIQDETGLRRLWDHQLRFHFEKVFRLDRQGLEEVRRRWIAISASGTRSDSTQVEAQPAAEAEVNE